jgi:hypothetical protein
MKNIQTILLGLLIVSGLIYVPYNEIREIRAQEQIEELTLNLKATTWRACKGESSFNLNGIFIKNYLTNCDEFLVRAKQFAIDLELSKLENITSSTKEIESKTKTPIQEKKSTLKRFLI